MQNQVVKVMVPEWLEPLQRKVILHVFIWGILAKKTVVSDLASVPLVVIIFPLKRN
jgi:hypothetical protein